MVAGRKLPTNVQAENAALSCALVQPDIILPIYTRMGLLPDHFTRNDRPALYRRMVELAQAGTTIDPVTLGKQWGDLLGELGSTLSTDTSQAARDYAQEVIAYALRRQRILDARQSANEAYNNKPLPHIIGGAQRALDKVRNAYTRTLELIVSNPADELAESAGWSIQFGVPWLDERLRLVSGRLHFLAGDPNSGKSSLALQSVGFNLSRGIPCAVIVAEDDALDVKLSLLAQTENIDMVFINRVMFDPTFKTQSNIEKVRVLWEQNFSDAPLRIIKVSEGPGEVVSAINALDKPHYVIVDHAFAVISQAEKMLDKEHMSFMRFFADVLTSTKRGNHITLMLNQYTKAARKALNRGPDSQYGGSGVQNIAFLMVHLWCPESDYTTAPSGWMAVMIECVKSKARLLVHPGSGTIVNPEDGPGTIYMHLAHRLVKERPMLL